MSLEYLKEIGQAKEAVKQIAATPMGKVAQLFTQKALEEMQATVPTSQAGTGELKQSLGLEYSEEGGTIIARFLAADYWDYVNSGVQGLQGGALPPVRNQYGTVYSFAERAKALSTGTSFTQSLKQWIINKGLVAEDGNYDGLAYVIMRAVKRKGIKPSEFMNKALSEEKMKAFEEALLDAFEKIV